MNNESKVPNLSHPLFDPIWNAIKRWDLQRNPGDGYAGATGDDVQKILDAIVSATLDQPQSEPAESVSDEDVELAFANRHARGVPDGWKVGMALLQSGTYHILDDSTRSACDALIAQNPYIAQPTAKDTDHV